MAICAVVFVAWVVTKKGAESSEAAAWIQAFGSIGAIIGAAWIANWQYRENIKKDRASRVESWLYYIELIEMCKMSLQMIIDVSGEDKKINYHALASYERSVNLLTSYPKDKIAHSGKLKLCILIEHTVSADIAHLKARREEALKANKEHAAEIVKRAISSMRNRIEQLSRHQEKLQD